MDISAGLQKEGDVLKTPVDGVSTRTVNLAKGLEVVSPQKPSSRKGIVSLTRGLTELSEEENASDNTPLGTDVDMKSILAKLQGSEMVSDSPSKAEAWEKKADAANQAEVIPSEEVLKSLGLTSAAVEEGLNYLLLFTITECLSIKICIFFRLLTWN